VTAFADWCLCGQPAQGIDGGSGLHKFIRGMLANFERGVRQLLDEFQPR
jgi:hypothetical protein